MALNVITLRRDGDYQRSVRWVIVGQLIRSCTSGGANLAEASAAQTKRDFAAKVFISKKEILETQYWLRLADEAGVFGEQDMTALRAEAASVGMVISKIARRAQEASTRGDA